MVSVNIEPLSYLLITGLPELAFEAYQELESEHLNEPYNPNWEAYQRRENNDGLRFFSLRDGAVLIGYASIVVSEDEHRGGILMGYFNDIFVTKEKRGHAAYLVRQVEKVLSEIGVRRIQAAEKVNIKQRNDAGKFLEALGYEVSEIIHSKVLH